MLQVTDVRSVVAIFQNVYRRPQVPPRCGLIGNSAFVTLKMARADAGEGVVRIVLFGIKVETELVAGPRREAKNDRLGVNSYRVVFAIRHLDRACAICGQRLSGT